MKLEPVFSNTEPGRTSVPRFRVRLEALGGAPATLQGAAASVALSCEVKDRVRTAEEPTAVPFATLEGVVNVKAGQAPSFVLSATTQEPLSEDFEQEGHRRPRRRVELVDPDVVGAEPRVLLLPDAAQLPQGFAELFATLTVDGAAHGTEDAHDVLDIPLVPFALTHAVFKFVDAAGKPKQGLPVRVRSSAADEREVTTDDFGEIYLDAVDGQIYEVTALLPEEDERLAMVSENSDNIFA